MPRSESTKRIAQWVGSWRLVLAILGFVASGCSVVLGLEETEATVDVEVQTGDCELGDGPRGCPGGAVCTEIVPGGFRVCTSEPDDAVDCSDGTVQECCSSADCTPGSKCYNEAILPAHTCGVVSFPPLNVCDWDMCNDQEGCEKDAVCLPRGAEARPNRDCLPAACRTDADCRVEPGGICAPVEDPCCPVWAGLYCVYPTDGCRTGADCALSQTCVVDTILGRSKCSEAPAPCAAPPG